MVGDGAAVGAGGIGGIGGSGGIGGVNGVPAVEVPLAVPVIEPVPTAVPPLPEPPDVAIDDPVPVADDVPEAVDVPSPEAVPPLVIKPVAVPETVAVLEPVALDDAVPVADDVPEAVDVPSVEAVPPPVPGIIIPVPTPLLPLPIPSEVALDVAVDEEDAVPLAVLSLEAVAVPVAEDVAVEVPVAMPVAVPVAVPDHTINGIWCANAAAISTMHHNRHTDTLRRISSIFSWYNACNSHGVMGFSGRSSWCKEMETIIAWQRLITCSKHKSASRPVHCRTANMSNQTNRSLRALAIDAVTTSLNGAPQQWDKKTVAGPTKGFISGKCAYRQRVAMVAGLMINRLTFHVGHSQRSCLWVNASNHLTDTPQR
jgi:hypothetical protein